MLETLGTTNSVIAPVRGFVKVSSEKVGTEGAGSKTFSGASPAGAGEKSSLTLANMPSGSASMG